MPGCLPSLRHQLPTLNFCHQSVVWAHRRGFGPEVGVVYSSPSRTDGFFVAFTSRDAKGSPQVPPWLSGWQITVVMAINLFFEPFALDAQHVSSRPCMLSPAFGGFTHVRIFIRYTKFEIQRLYSFLDVFSRSRSPCLQGRVAA